MVGAPYARAGRGAIYLFHGAANRDSFETRPVQTIAGNDTGDNTVRTFGWSLAGGADVDDNGYGDLLVGAFNSDAAVLIRY